MSHLRGDEATLYERYARRLERSVARALGADREHAEDACAFAWAQLCATQPERREELFAWLRTTAIREGWRLAQLARRERAPTPAGDEHETEPAWEDRLAAAETLEHALDGRAAVEVLTSLRRREALPRPARSGLQLPRDRRARRRHLQQRYLERLVSPALRRRA